MPTDACVAFYDCNGCGERLEAAPRKLLCFLFLRLGAVSTNSRGCRALLHSATRPKLQEAATRQLLVSLPLTSILAMVGLWRDTGGPRARRCTPSRNVLALVTNASDAPYPALSHAARG